MRPTATIIIATTATFAYYTSAYTTPKPHLALHDNSRITAVVKAAVEPCFEPMPWKQSITCDASEDENEVDYPPLLYMPFWTWQKEFMQEHLTDLVEERPVGAATGRQFSYNENTKKGARIVNECYSAPGLYSKIRMTYYDAGEGCQVFNSVWYPDPKHKNLPLLGIDLLSFNRKKFLGIVDFQPIYNSPSEGEHDLAALDYEEKILKPIKEKYEFLKGQKMSSKFYDETQFFSKEMLFARFENENIIMEELMPAFQDYVASHVEMVMQSEKDQMISEQKVKQRYMSYDTYSAVRDPATGLFAGMFGKEWADDFVYDFLFDSSDREEAQKSAESVQKQQAAQRQRAAQEAAKADSKKSRPDRPAFATAR